MKFTGNPLQCPRCGNTEIEPDHHYCMICGLRIKENAPTGAATPEQGASEKCHLQYSTGGENVKLSNHHYQPGAGKY